MKALLSFWLILVGVPGIVAQQTAVCPCTPSTKFPHQDRSIAKHETNYSKYFKKKDTITVSYIYAWQAKYDVLTSKITTKDTAATAKRKHHTPEDSLYVLKGYMWFVKQEGNDCDFHIEIGTKDSASIRIVVEVPQENKTVQAKIKQELDNRKYHIEGCKPGTSGDYHFPKGIPVVVTGLGFYDASHKPMTKHGDHHTYRYSWELHPVKDVVFLK
jgi:hypothetical protein